MTTISIRKKLYDYIRVAEDRMLKAIYTMLEGEIEEGYDYGNNKDFVKELYKRSVEFKRGKVKAGIMGGCKSPNVKFYKAAKEILR